MPPKKVTVKTPQASNILVLFNKSESVETKSDLPIPSCATESTLTHPDPLVQEYYASLSPNEKLAHTIAIDKLGTSYDVSRTHGFLRWQKSRGK